MFYIGSHSNKFNKVVPFFLVNRKSTELIDELLSLIGEKGVLNIYKNRAGEI